MSLFEFSSKATDDETWPISATIVGKNTSKGFTEYSINVQHGFNAKNQWEVQRRYNHFFSLHQNLQTFGLSLPDLPPKKFVKNLDPDFIAKRQRELQRYLDELISHPLLIHFFAVKEFFGFRNVLQTNSQERAQQIVSLSLRSGGQWQICEVLPKLGWRPKKHRYFIKSTTDKFDKSKFLLTWSFFGADFFLSQDELEKVFDYLKSKKCVLPGIILPTLFWSKSEAGALYVENFRNQGSLKDLLNEKKPKEHFLKKYGNLPLPEKTALDFDPISIAFQVLRLIASMHRFGIGFGHLHTGNIFFDQDTGECQLGDFINSFLGLPNEYRMYAVQCKAVKTVQQLDIYCYGHFLFELFNLHQLGAAWISGECVSSKRVDLLLWSILGENVVQTELPNCTELLQNELWSRFRLQLNDLKIPVKFKNLLEKCQNAVEKRLAEDRKTYIRTLRQAEASEIFNDPTEKMKRRRQAKLQLNIEENGLKSPFKREGSPSSLSLDEDSTNKPKQNSVPIPPAPPQAPPLPMSAFSPPPPPPPPPLASPPGSLTNGNGSDTASIASVGSDRSAMLDSIRNFDRNALKRSLAVQSNSNSKLN